MASEMTKVKINAMREIFFTQIGLLLLLAILFIIGNNFMTVGTLFFAIILGALGASISLLNRVRNNTIPDQVTFEDLKLFATLIPILYGTVMSGVAYLFFMSGILTGENGGGLLVSNLFPTFSASENPDLSILEQFIIMRPDGIQNTGKLMVWCFLAGYSERFVTGILNQLENQSGANGGGAAPPKSEIEISKKP